MWRASRPGPSSTSSAPCWRRPAARLRLTKRIERCAATNVDPATGQRDREIPKALMRLYGHVDCGIYAEVLSGGRLAEGERLAVEPPAQAALPFG